MSRLSKRLPKAAASLTMPSAGSSSRITEAPPNTGDDALAWVVTPDHGRAHLFDLRHLFDGDLTINITARPGLLTDLLADARILATGRSQGRVGQQLMSLRHFWRFLDRQEAAGIRFGGIQALDETDGVMFHSYLVNDVGSASVAYSAVGYIRALLNLARRRLNPSAQELLWPTSKPREPLMHKDVDPRILKPLYAVLKAQYYSFISVQQRGRDLLTAGADPRSIGDGNQRDAWSVEANVAVVAADFVSRASVEARTWGTSVHRYFGNPTNFRLPAFGSPPLGERLRPFHRMRWYAPHPADAAACFLLVQMHFGWNVSTVRSLDVSEPDAWFTERLSGTTSSPGGSSVEANVAIFGYKNRSGKEQIAFSRTRPQHHPFQILKTMISATERLRSGLRERLAALESTEHPSPAVRLEINKLRSDIRSPWLCMPRAQGSSEGTRVSPMPTSILNKQFSIFCRLAYKDALRRLVRDRRVRNAQGVLDRRLLRELIHPYQMLRRLTPSDLRDGFSSYIYERSLSDIFVVQRSLGHRGLRTTRHYLRQRRQIAERFGAFMRFQEALWTEIAEARRIDPTILFLRTTAGGLTDAQRTRLENKRELSRLGLGCLDPMHPPAEIAPDHEYGPCPVQRCVLCRHGILFEDSLGGLAVRTAELRQIRRQIAAGRWTGSSFELEWVAIELVISRFFQDRREAFEAMTQTHLALLDSGRAYLFDQAPPRFTQEASPL